MVRFRSLRRHLRLRFRSRNGFLPISEEASGQILFRSRGLLRPRSGLLRRARVSGLDLFLKEARLGPVLFPLPDLGDSVHRFRLGRVLVRSAILRVGRDSLREEEHDEGDRRVGSEHDHHRDQSEDAEGDEVVEAEKELGRQVDVIAEAADRFARRRW